MTSFPEKLKKIASLQYKKPHGREAILWQAFLLATMSSETNFMPLHLLPLLLSLLSWLGGPPKDKIKELI